jgi:hypothetical protein
LRTEDRSKIAAFSSSGAVAHAAISSSVRPHPRHQPLAGSMTQIFVQGDFIGVA